MARVSRKNKNIDENIKEEKVAKVFKTAIYTRLSLEDKRKLIDNSIENQLDLVKQYVAQKPYLKLVGVFSDNGATGRNFDRPEFIKMMDEIRNGNVNCLIVKDE